MDLLYGWMVDASAIWGIRRVLKLAKNRLLPHVKKRVVVTIPSKGHFLHQGSSGRPIEFIATIGNPNPLETVIHGREVRILNRDVCIATVCDSTEILVPRETPVFRIALAMYHPPQHPAGLPCRNEEWRLEGELRLRCYLGEWQIDIPRSDAFSVSGQWEEARDHVAQIMHEME